MLRVVNNNAVTQGHSRSFEITEMSRACVTVGLLVIHCNNNNNNNNNQDSVYGAVIMAEPLREFTRFI